MFSLPHRTFEELYWRDVRPQVGCWEWSGQLHNYGYGVLRNGKKRVYALFIGPVPSGLHVHSVCGQHSCTNPQHLEAINQSEQLRRSHWTDTQRLQRLAEIADRPFTKIHPPTPSPFPSVDTRFWGRIDKTPTCWLWQGGTTTAGYGLIQFNGVKWLTHRLAYHLLVGPIPPRMQVHHVCRNRRCVNPAHFQLLSIEEHGRISTLPA
jgi:hypothetical protein